MTAPPEVDNPHALAVPTTGSGAPPKTALVVGSSPDWSQIQQDLPTADLVFSYDLVTAARLAERAEHLECRVVDVYAKMKMLEDEAWEWARDLTGAASQRLPMLSHRFKLMRRSCFAGPLFEIAAARARAAQVAEVAPRDCLLLLRGLTPIDRAALSERFATTSCASNLSAEVENEPVPQPPRRRLAMPVRLLRNELSSLARLRRARAEVELARKGSESRILAVHVGVPAHLRVLRPAVDELASRGWAPVLVDMSRQSVLDQAGSVAFWSLYRKESFGRLVLRRLLGPALSGCVLEWAAGHDLSAFAGGLRDWFVSYCFFDAAGLIEAHKVLQQSLRQELSLTANETVPEVEACASAGRAAGIPAVNVQHGVITQTKRRAEFDFDAFCVFGQEYARILEQNGTPQESIKVVGNPLLDSNATLVSREAEDVRRSLDIPPDRFLILFAAQYAGVGVTEWVLYRSLRLVLDAVSARDDVHLLIKWHPSGAGREDAYEVALKERHVENITATRSADLYRLISASDCVAMLSSTVGFEAAALRKPVIVINPVEPPFGSPFLDAETALDAQTADGFNSRVNWLQSGGTIPEARFEDLDLRYHYRRDGHAGVRIANVCESLVEAK